MALWVLKKVLTLDRYKQKTQRWIRKQDLRGDKLKGGFVKGWFWLMCPRSGFRSGGNMRTYPRSGFRSGGTFECTLVLVFHGVPKHGRSKRSHSQKHANERKRAQTQIRKRAQKGAKGCKRALPRRNCKQPGLKQSGLGTPHLRSGGTSAKTTLFENYPLDCEPPKRQSQRKQTQTSTNGCLGVFLPRPSVAKNPFGKLR